MKIANKTFKKYSFFMVLGLLAAIFSTKIEAMKLSSLPKQRAFVEHSSIPKRLALKVKSLKPNEYYIYQTGTDDGIVVPLDVLEKSVTLKNMITDIGDESRKAIPQNISASTIKRVFKVLNDSSPQGEIATILKDLSLGELVSDINIIDYLEAPLGQYETEIMNRIAVMLKEFSQILANYRTWSDPKPSSRFTAWLSSYKAQEPPVPNYPQYDELKNLKNTVSELIKTQLFKDKKSIFMNNLRDLSSTLTLDDFEIIGENEKNLINFLNEVKSYVQHGMAWRMWTNDNYPYKNYWINKKLDSFRDKDKIIDYYYKQLKAAEFDKK